MKRNFLRQSCRTDSQYNLVDRNLSSYFTSYAHAENRSEKHTFFYISTIDVLPRLFFSFSQMQYNAIKRNFKTHVLRIVEKYIFDRCMRSGITHAFKICISVAFSISSCLFLLMNSLALHQSKCVYKINCMNRNLLHAVVFAMRGLFQLNNIQPIFIYNVTHIHTLICACASTQTFSFLSHGHFSSSFLSRR